jgi:hypothetical protein
MAIDQSVATFHTTHAALSAEKAAQKAGVSAKLMPAPRSLSADCTLALCFASTDIDRVRDILNARTIEVAGFYRLNGNTDVADTDKPNKD